MRAERRDDNEAGIVDLFRKAGAYVVRQPRDNGFDLLVLFRGSLFVVEVKDGQKSPAHRKLTPNEETAKSCIEQTGVTYHIVTSRDDAARLLGVPYNGTLL